jgi:hypothetical protein
MLLKITLRYNTSMLGSIITIVFQNVFHSEIYQNNIFNIF